MFSLLLWPAILHYCVAFNIDTNLPLVRQNDQKGSYFGFSVAQHQASNSDSSVTSWLLVGAPKANVSEMLTKNIVNPGAVYKCDLTKPDCEQIDFDTGGNTVDADNEELDDKSNMWFGVSLHSSGLDGTVLSCAHRYLYYGRLRKYHMYPGRCFSTKKKMSARSIYAYEECKKKNDEDASNPNSVATYTKQLYCQMGVSSMYIPDRNAMTFGAPGSMNYQGVLYYHQDVPNFGAQIYNDSAPFGYQGYSTSIGTFFTKGRLDIVTGAPRYNHHGMVVVFADTASAETPMFKSRSVLLPTEADGPPQPGSGFGFSVAGVDVNGDGWTDVVIGAPFYSTKNSPNEGRVFVYTNNGDGTFSKTRELAPSIARKGAYFGHAVANLGDLDQDGYEDFAVGAPYEEGTGVVYIFNGSETGVSQKAGQLIKPTDINQDLKTFGSSIAGKLDMDGNGYPDLLIGAYTSDSVVLLRSRPIIDINTDVNITPNPFNSRNKTCSKTFKGKLIQTVCIDIEICLSYSERRNRTHDKLSIDLNIEADVEYTRNSRTSKQSRVVFSTSEGPALNKTLTDALPHKPRKACFLEEVFLRENVEDVYPDITFRINYKMHEPSVPPTAAPGTLSSLKDYAMLETKKGSFASAMLKFQRDCVKCEPNLQISDKSDRTLAVGERDYVVDVTISNTGESAYNTELLVTIPEGVAQSRVLDASDTDKEAFSIGHQAVSDKTENNSTRLRIPIGNPMKTRTMKRVQVFLNTGSFSKSQDFLPILLEVTSSNKEQPEQLKDNLIELNVTIVSQADLELSGSFKQEQVSYGGEVKGESAMRVEDEIGNEVRHTYIAQNKGPDFVPEAEVVIQWPFEATNGKHLLYLMDVEISGNAECTFAPDQPNLLGLIVKPKSSPARNVTSRQSSSESTRTTRVRRAVEEETSIKTKRATADERGSSVKLDCETGTARCTPIRCLIKRFAKGNEVSFVVRSRIWAATLIEDYYNTDKSSEVTVVSRASLRAAVTFVRELNKENNNAEVKTQFNPDFPPRKSDKLASWVIPVAVVGAILALVIVILILWKLGFFKRKKFDGNITEAEMEAILAAEKKEKNANSDS
ncbi:integrin alpha-6 [Nematostella vectensis]|uniref:integrin alpha-6 n=1 Tax=Nematostella vectensis TaxID=45351 RepID=UPI001390228F|nr:integrin alpha-6 [Nematostella vectensis]